MSTQPTTGYGLRNRGSAGNQDADADISSPLSEDIMGGIQGHQDTSEPNSNEDTQDDPTRNESIDPLATIKDQLDKIGEALLLLGQNQRIITEQRATQLETNNAKTNHKEPKVNAPDEYYGERNKLTGFLTQCQLVFDLQPDRYSTDYAKIRYMISFFRRAPLYSIEAHLAKDNNDQPLWLHDYNLFIKHIKRTYGDPDEIHTAEKKLLAIQQKQSVTNYFAEFEQLSSLLDWPDSVLIAKARDGLKPSLKDAIATKVEEIPKTWNDFVTVITRLDERMHEREQEKRHEQGRTEQKIVETISKRSRPPVSTFTRLSETKAIDGTVQPRATNQWNSNPFVGLGMRPRLSESERQKRRESNLCYSCGQSGHMAKDCSQSTRPQVPAVSSSATSTYQRTTTPSFATEQSKVGAPSR